MKIDFFTSPPLIKGILTLRDYLGKQNYPKIDGLRTKVNINAGKYVLR